jgi:DNA-binding NarL/FixJ family response regulator
MKNYLVFRRDYPGFICAEVSSEGKTDNVIVHNIIQSMKRGKYTRKGYDLLLVPDTRNSYGALTAKKKDCVKLGSLFAPRKNRGSDKGLITITEKNRYRGKVDWDKKRLLIGQLLRQGKSVSEVAKRFGVSPSTLSKANKRHDLYEPKQPPCK